jgi:hypothetical protein
MSWLSDIGGTLGSIGGTLGAFVPGVGQAIAGVGGLLAMTDDPEALILFPEYPFAPGGMAYGITRRAPGGDPRGFHLGGASWTNGPTYKSEDTSSYALRLWGMFAQGSGTPQPATWEDVDGVFAAQGYLAHAGQLFRINLTWLDVLVGVGGYSTVGPTSQQVDARIGKEKGALVYGALWGLDLETMVRNPIGPGPRRLFIRDDDSNRIYAFEVPEFLQIQRGPLREIVVAERGQAAAEFWRDEWLNATEPAFDSSVADLKTWDEHGGGAVQTWMQSAPLWDKQGASEVYRGYPQLEAWTNLETPESQIAFEQWATYQAVELAKYQTAGAEWWSQKQQIEAQAAWDIYQAEAEAYYWEQYQANQAQSAAYLEQLTAVSNPFATPPQGNPQSAQTSLTGDVPPIPPPPPIIPAPELPADPYIAPAPAVAAEPLTVGEEEAIGIGAAAAALLIL